MIVASPRNNHQNFGLSDVAEAPVLLREVSKNDSDISANNNDFKTTPLITVTKSQDSTEELKITSINFMSTGNCANDTNVIYKNGSNGSSTNNTCANGEYS